MRRDGGRLQLNLPHEHFFPSASAPASAIFGIASVMLLFAGEGGARRPSLPPLQTPVSIEWIKGCGRDRDVVLLVCRRSTEMNSMLNVSRTSNKSSLRAPEINLPGPQVVSVGRSAGLLSVRKVKPRVKPKVGRSVGMVGKTNFWGLVAHGAAVLYSAAGINIALARSPHPPPPPPPHRTRIRPN